MIIGLGLGTEIIIIVLSDRLEKWRFFSAFAFVNAGKQQTLLRHSSPFFGQGCPSLLQKSPVHHICA